MDDSLVVAVVHSLNYLTKLLPGFSLIHTTILNQVLYGERGERERERERMKNEHAAIIKQSLLPYIYDQSISGQSVISGYDTHNKQNYCTFHVQLPTSTRKTLPTTAHFKHCNHKPHKHTRTVPQAYKHTQTHSLQHLNTYVHPLSNLHVHVHVTVI